MDFAAHNETLDTLLEERRPFLVEREGDALTFLPCKTTLEREAFTSAHTLVDVAIERLSTQPTRSIPHAEFLTIRRYTDLVSRYIRVVETRHTGRRQALEELWRRLLIARLGGKVSLSSLSHPGNGDCVEFVLANHLHHALQAVRQEIRDVPEEQTLTLPLEHEDGETRHVRWSELERKDLIEDGEVVRCSFVMDGTIVFETKPSLRLTDDYSFSWLGIRKYNAKGLTKEIRPFDRRDPAEWGGGHVLEIWTALIHSAGTRPAKTVGDHSYACLKDDEGNVYSLGKFGARHPWKWHSYLNVLGKRLANVEAPDRMVFFPTVYDQNRKWRGRAGFHFDHVDFSLTRAQFEAIRDSWSRDKADPDLLFSPLAGNCTAFMSARLREWLGIDARPELYFPEYLLRAHLLPPHVADHVLPLLNKEWILTGGRLAYWSGLILAPWNVLGGIAAVCLLFRLLALSRFGTSDVSFWRLLLLPWRASVADPYAFRRALHVAIEKKKET